MLGIKATMDVSGCKQEGAIGDTLIYSSFPENYYYTFGEKVVDIQKFWFFDNNPFVIRDAEYDKVLNLLRDDLCVRPDINRSYASLAERTKLFFNPEQNIVLRHPRLYKYEDIPVNPLGVVIHTTGMTHPPMGDHIIEHLHRKYKNHDVIQIGGIHDKPTGFKSQLGLSRWEMAEIIASNQTFIGINSGLQHIANCYPNITKKIILNQDLEDLVPLNPSDCHSHWFDYGVQFFNPSNYDIGITFSYLKI
jgi:hypothetical protein